MKTRLTLGYNTEHDTDTQENDVDNIPGTKSIFGCYNPILWKRKVSSSKGITKLQDFTGKPAEQV